jgi:peptidylprolyl isomerase/FKBP-type peptidyl-prolyl cis-trans isomerase FklB
MRLVAIALALVVGLGVAACHAGDPAGDNLKAAQGFLILNGKQPDVITLPSGLEYKVVHSGPVEGAHPGPGDEMKVNYEGKLLNGMVFDSSFARGEPADLPLDGLVPGWMQALPMMRPGDEWILYVPPALGYGEHGAVGIPPNSLLIFRIQLLGVLQHPAAMG